MLFMLNLAVAVQKLGYCVIDFLRKPGQLPNWP
jgi:hypothetical protein